MPARESAPAGAPCWVDLMTSDTARSRDFYGAVFGWAAEEPNPEFGGYFNFTKNGVRVAGCMTSEPGSGLPDTWSVYLATDDAAKTLEAAAGHGAQIVVPAMTVGDLGTMAMLTDPSGAAIGIWQPGLHKGFGLVTEPGAPSWFEVLTPDYPGTISFYRDVFGWDTQVAGDTPEFRYTVGVRGAEQLAGIMDASGFLPAGQPAAWSVFFGTADTDAALATITRLGGSVLRPAEDTPYGRLAEAADPNGARFKLVAANPAMPAQDG
ncbi:MAG: VOC family protein [Streptosporangiaceae bacterium]